MSYEDRAALVALFRSTGGTHWKWNNNWDTDADLSQWYGVQVNEDGRVVDLWLSRNNLKGTIPEAVGALTELKKLGLWDNKLTGPIPEALGALKELTHLFLSGNKLKGNIPEAIGALTELKGLALYDNKLAGPIPEAFGGLKELTFLYLGGNKLTGHIPKELGNLEKLRTLHLQDNHLTGVIPTELGNLSALSDIGYGKNAPKSVWRRRKKLTGGPSKGEGLDSWRARMRRNQTTKPQTLEGGKKEEDAPVPPSPPPPSLLPQQQEEAEGDGKQEDAQVPTASTPPVLLLQQQEESDHDKKEEGAPVPSLATPPSLLPQHQEESEGNEKDEGAPVPTACIPPVSLHQQQETGEVDEKQEDAQAPTAATPPAVLPQQQEEGERDEKQEGATVPSPSTPPVLLPQEQHQEGEVDENEEDAPVLLDTPNQSEETAGERVRSPEHASLSPEKTEEVDRLFTAQLSSSAGLDSLISENPEALEDIQRVIEATTARRIYPDDELSDMDGHRKLGTLVTMSTALGEVALKYTEDMDVQRKELALPPFLKAYCTAVRSGLCQAYLAASVIDSDWVSTSKTGPMSKAGEALKLISSAVPVVGGLTGLAGNALEAGDHYLQTRRLVKITAMAPDTVECCSLARRLALRLTDGLRNEASDTPDDADEVDVHTTAGMNGGSGSGRGADMTPGDMSEEDVFEYLLDEVASYKRNDNVGVRFGKKHVRKLLKAIQRGRLDGSNCTEQKIEVLLLEILPEADIKPAATPSTPKEVIVRSPPVVAPAHDGGLPSVADFAAMRAELAALKSAKDKQQAEMEAIKSDREKQQAELQAELEGLTSAKDELERKVKKLEKHVPELDSEPDDDVDFAGGLALRRRVAVTETVEGFLDRARDRAARAADHHPVTVAEQREFEVLQNEKHRGHEARLRELEGQINKATKQKGRR